MDPLLEELIANGILDVAAASFAHERQLAQGGAIDTALLELDLIDEDGLLRGLQRSLRMKTATASDLDTISPEIAKRLPQGFSKSFFMVPLRFSGAELVALVQRPLSEAALQELKELFGLQVQPLLAPAHYLAVAAQRVYGTALEERHRQLEARLRRKRSAPALERVLSNLAHAGTFAAAVDELLDFATRFVDFACLFVTRPGELGVANRRRSGVEVPASVPLPDSGCSLGPAIVHAGYFFGPLAASEADRRFFQAFGRSIPRCAFVAPVPRARTRSTVFYADNGERGIAARWVAELTVLLGHLGQKGSEATKKQPAAAPVPEQGGRALSPADASIEERAAIARLRAAAAASQTDFVAFVDELLRRHSASTPREQATSALVDEMKGLFEKLATDIPAHLARGVQAALRDLSPPRPAQNSAPVAAPATASVEIVQKPAALRETASYQSRRQKTPRVKL